MKLDVQKIDVIMGQKNLKQTELAELCGCTRQYICQIRRTGRAGHSTAAMLAVALGCAVSDIADVESDRVRFNADALMLAMFHHGFSMKQLARLANIAPQTVSKALHGDAVTARIANRIAWALGAELSDLVQKGE